MGYSQAGYPGQQGQQNQGWEQQDPQAGGNQGGNQGYQGPQQGGYGDQGYQQGQNYNYGPQQTGYGGQQPQQGGYQGGQQGTYGNHGGYGQGQGGYGNQAPPAPAQNYTAQDFYNQKIGAGKPLNSSFEQGMEGCTVELTVTGVPFVQEQTDPNTNQPKFNTDRSPMLSLVVPGVINPVLPGFDDEKAQLYVQGQLKNELARAQSEAGAPIKAPQIGDKILIRFEGFRKVNKKGMNPARVLTLWFKPAGGPAPAPAPTTDVQPPQEATGPQGQQYGPPQGQQYGPPQGGPGNYQGGPVSQTGPGQQYAPNPNQGQQWSQPNGPTGPAPLDPESQQVLNDVLGPNG